MASDSNKNKGISANMASTTEGRMSQTAPTNDDHTRRPRWSDGEDKMLCDILKTQWQLEKDGLGKLNGTKFWPLVSSKLKECGFDRTSEQCRSYWYGTIRVRPEFKDTLQFRTFNDRHSTPLAMATMTGTGITSGPTKLGTTPQSLFSTDTGESRTGTRSSSNSSFSTGAEQDTSRTKSGGTAQATPSSSMSQMAKDNGAMSRWKDHETQKLRELVLAKRSSTTEDQKELGVPFWTSISQELANSGINRTWQACARRFQRTNQGSHIAEPSFQAKDAAVDPMPGKLYHAEPNNEDTDAEEDDGSRLDLDNGDTPYGEDGEPRRGSRNRISKPAWSDEEHNRLVQLMKARRALENEDESLEKLSKNKLFVWVSKQLKQYLIDRSPGACTLYWNNKGAARSDFNIDPQGPALNGISKEPSGNGISGLSAMEELSPVAKDIEDAYDRLPQQDFDDSPFVQSFVKGNIEQFKPAEKRARGIWYADSHESDEADERAKRRRSAGNDGNVSNDPKLLGRSPGMVKRRAPKRDPSLPLLKHNASMASGYVVPDTMGTSGERSGTYDAEFPMKMKIRELENEILALETSKQTTVSEIQDDESEMMSVHNKMELLQVQKQKLQQSRREKEDQLDIYSTKIEKLKSQKKHLEVALDIVGGRV